MFDLQIAILSGSARKDNNTVRVSEVINRHLKDQGVPVILLYVGELNLPIYSETEEVEEARKFCAAIEESDGLIVVTPEYHGSFSGVVKNAIDYLDEDKELKAKPVGLVGVSSGRGGTRPLSHLRDVFRALDAVIIPTQIAVTGAGNAVENEKFIDPTNQKRLKEFSQELLWYAKVLRYGRENI